MNFGPAAHYYARCRVGFPRSFFERVQVGGLVLDLGSGTGSLARGFEDQGARVVALDVSSAMLAKARDVTMRVAARAEACPFRDRTFDTVVAGQCWHWFDGQAAAREVLRVLKPRGRILIAHFDYLTAHENIAAVTERIILEFDPAWSLAGSDGRYERWRPHLMSAGFEDVDSFFYDEDVVYSHEAWRGRMRACNGVIALRDQERIEAFDSQLARLLSTYPDPVVVPHRIFVISGTGSKSIT